MLVERLALPDERYATVVHPAASIGVEAARSARARVLLARRRDSPPTCAIGAHVAVDAAGRAHPRRRGRRLRRRSASGVRLGGGVGGRRRRRTSAPVRWSARASRIGAGRSSAWAPSCSPTCRRARCGRVHPRAPSVRLLTPCWPRWGPRREGPRLPTRPPDRWQPDQRDRPRRRDASSAGTKPSCMRSTDRCAGTSRSVASRSSPPTRCTTAPGPTRIPQLHRLVRSEGIDVIHAYEWPPALDAFYGAHLSARHAAAVHRAVDVGLSARPARPAARHGHRRARRGGPARRLRRCARCSSRRSTSCCDTPGTDGTAWRRQLGIDDDELAVVSVSRLSIELKLDALVDAIDAAGLLADRAPGAARAGRRRGRGSAAARARRRGERRRGPRGRAPAGSARRSSPRLRRCRHRHRDGQLRAAGAWPTLDRSSSKASTGGPCPAPRPRLPRSCGRASGATGRRPRGGPCWPRSSTRSSADGDRRRTLGAWAARSSCERFSLASAGSALVEVYESLLDAPRPPLAARAREALRRAVGGRPPSRSGSTGRADKRQRASRTLRPPAAAGRPIQEPRS